MDSFRWSQCFVTGLVEVDEQHYHLVEVINQFGDLLVKQESVSLDDIESVFQELVIYAQYHFSEEYSLMSRIGVDTRHIENHHQEHTRFLEEVIQMHANVLPRDPRSALSLQKFLVHWLAYHILGTDKNLAKQINAIQAGQTAAESYLLEEQQNDTTEPLLNALNGLFYQVSERNRELYELNKTLEAKVAVRTKALQEANQRLEEMAMTDVLTGLKNRRSALQSLAEEWTQSVRDGLPLSCMMIDADHFKEINDSYGHDAGDEVLRMLSRQLINSVRTDDIVCRLGGDEFLIICPRTSLAGAMQVAEKIRLEISRLKIAAGDGEWIGSISVGVAVRNDDMNTLEDLLKEADDGVYVSKRNGRNSVATTSKINL